MNDQIPNTLCRYFLHGACSRGATCKYAHDLEAKSYNTCKFFLAGNCSYGKQCRYDHVRPKQNINDIPKTSPTSRMVILKKKKDEAHDTRHDTSNQSTDWSSAPDFVPGKKIHKTTGVQDQDVMKEVSFSKMASFNAPQQQHTEISFQDTSLYQEELLMEDSYAGRQKELLCPFAAFRDCPLGESCEYIHGDVCEMCGLQALHPSNQEQREEHNQQCMERLETEMKIAFAAQKSDGVTCSICLEVVREKANPSERYFGLLENCNHPFCLSCIRKWRSSSLEKNIVRTCPMCREQSWFITPSEYWVDSATEKREAIESYKSYLNTKDCRLFDQGNGNCPFGTSCFYKHAYPDGNLESTKPELRYLEDGLGNVKIHKTTRLNEFIEHRE